ncbi:hypothetical protein LINGRAHAP2_LOCUS6390 [Linum grandiflorum]
MIIQKKKKKKKKKERLWWWNTESPCTATHASALWPKPYPNSTECSNSPRRSTSTRWS